MCAQRDSLVINLEIFLLFFYLMYMRVLSPSFVIYYMYWNNYYFIVGYLIVFIFRRKKCNFAYLEMFGFA